MPLSPENELPLCCDEAHPMFPSSDPRIHRFIGETMVKRFLVAAETETRNPGGPICRLPGKGSFVAVQQRAAQSGDYWSV